jgi:peroxiredoxin
MSTHAKLSITIMALTLASAASCKKDEPRDPPAAPAPSATEPSAPTAAAPPSAPAPAAPSAGATATPPGLTPPTGVPPSPVLGKPAPDFTLEALDGSKVSLSSFKGKVVVLEWFNPKCPFVQRAHTKGSLAGAAKKHTDAGVVWLAVNSGAAGKQGHEVADNQAAVKEWSLGHPVLRDVAGEVGMTYGATNTPHMFVIDAAGTVVYAGAIDNSPDGEGASPTGGTLVKHVDAALADLAAGRPVATPLTKAYGCSVKYDS